MATNIYTYLAPLKDEIAKCIKCGVCMAGCPTYTVTRDETMVARGRITLIGATINGRIEPSRKLEDSITSCIGCLTCDINCPTEIKIGEIIFAAKAQIAQTKRMNIFERILSNAVVGLRWPLPVIARLSSIPLKLYDLIPLNSPLGHLLPFVKGGVKRKLPVTGGPSLTSQYPEIMETMSKRKRGRVAFFPGCVIDLSTHDIGRATISVLNKLGYDVIIPKGQYCCGSPLRSLGNIEMARKVAMKNIDLFSSLDVEAIIVSCATCGHTLKREYPVLLNHSLNGEFEKVKAFSEKVVDIHEFIYKNPPPLFPHPALPHKGVGKKEGIIKALPQGEGRQQLYPHPLMGGGEGEGEEGEGEEGEGEEGEGEGEEGEGEKEEGEQKGFSGDRYRVTFHDPCHLKKGLGIYQYPRDILKAIPSAEFIEMEDADACCGFGGIFSLYHYDLASAIGERKAENIKRTGAQIVATGCPGCKIHIEDTLHRAGYNAKVRHTVELFDEVL